MIIDLLSQYSVKASGDQNIATLENMYLEEEQKNPLRQDPRAAVGDEYQLTAYPTPGLVTFCTTGEANVRALCEHNEITYCVAGNKFGSIDSSGTFAQLGSNLTTSSGFAKIVAITGSSDTNNQLVIIDGTNGYSYNLGTSTATFPIADADFPQTCSDIIALDDYIIYQKNSSIVFGLSDVSDSLTYAALDFSSKLRKSDKIGAISDLNGELWLLGTKTAEVHIDTGNSDFQFERRPDVFLEQGIAAQRTLCKAASTLLYLGKNLNGGYGIAQIDHYDAKVISPKSIMTLIGGMTTISDAFAYGHAPKGGHEFYSLTFPTENKTIELDMSNGAWTIRSSYISSTYGRFLGNCHAFCYNKSLIGDYNSGLVYYQDAATYTENGTAIRRRFISPHIYSEGKLIECRYLQIDLQTNVGSNKTFTLEMSNDHGNSWSTVGTYTVPTAGDGQIRVPALGTSVVFTFRITTTDNFKFVIRGFQGNFTQAEW